MQRQLEYTTAGREVQSIMPEENVEISAAEPLNIQRPGC